MRDIDKMFLAIIGVVIGIIFVCGMFDSQHENVTTWEGNLIVAQLPPHNPRLVIDLESAVKMSSVPITNITIMLPNQHGNVSIYKGDERVCCIPANTTNPLILHWAGTWNKPFLF